MPRTNMLLLFDSAGLVSMSHHITRPHRAVIFKHWTVLCKDFCPLLTSMKAKQWFCIEQPFHWLPVKMNYTQWICLSFSICAVWMIQRPNGRGNVPCWNTWQVWINVNAKINMQCIWERTTFTIKQINSEFSFHMLNRIEGSSRISEHYMKIL